MTQEEYKKNIQEYQPRHSKKMYKVCFTKPNGKLAYMDLYGMDAVRELNEKAYIHKIVRMSDRKEIQI